MNKWRAIVSLFAVTFGLGFGGEWTGYLIITGTIAATGLWVRSTAGRPPGP